MNDYKVLTACEIDGTNRSAGDIVQLTAEAAQPIIDAGAIEIVTLAGGAEVSAKEAGAGEGGAAAGSGAAGEISVADAAGEVDAPRVLAQEDIDANPILVELAAEVGDAVRVLKPVQA